MPDYLIILIEIFIYYLCNIIVLLKNGGDFMKTPADVEKEYFETLKSKEIKKISLNLGAETVK